MTKISALKELLFQLEGHNINIKRNQVQSIFEDNKSHEPKKIIAGLGRCCGGQREKNCLNFKLNPLIRRHWRKILRQKKLTLANSSLWEKSFQGWKKKKKGMTQCTLPFPLSETGATARLGTEQWHILVFKSNILGNMWRLHSLRHG